MSYLWFQQTGGEDAWLEGLSEHRQKIIKERRPAFMTVLDAHSSPDSSWDREEYSKMAYSGPLYFDFDAESIDVTIPQFHKFIANLVELGVEMKCVRLYATGGRGFHIEIPPQVFMPKVPKTGTKQLPYIYREMAYKLAVDTLDLRVYTGRKGRMWRTVGVERSNGKFKVPITLEQAVAMDAELYEELCSVRVTEELPVSDPEFSMALASMFKSAQDKVDAAIKNRAKAGADEALLAKFKGQFPPTIEAIMRGENLAPGVGFHKLAMQLAITANALGKTAEQLVEASDGLCKTHASDSDRYGSPRKRKEELRRMWEYTHDNPCYSYSKGGIRSLVDVDTPTGDLDGVAQTSGVGTVDDSEDDENATEEEKAQATSADQALVDGVFINRSGLHRKTVEGPKSLSNIGLTKVQIMKEGVGKSKGTVLGIEADVFSDKAPLGRHIFTDKEFTSRNALNAKFFGYGGIFNGTDNQASSTRLVLVRSAKRGERVVYTLHKEGLDLIEDPSEKDRSEKHVVWVHHEKVFSQQDKTQYVYHSPVNKEPTFKADVHLAKPITNTPDNLEWLKAVLSVNSDTTTAQMVGWFVSCFHRQFYHHAFSQFPLLHPNGTAGSGKTLTSDLFARMHFMKENPVARACGNGSTPFSLRQAMIGSASIPLILDEYKPSEMGTVRTDMLLQSFRLAYNQGIGASGGMGGATATSSFRDINEYSFSTPLCFMAESQEMQTAIVQRSLPVAFSSEDCRKHTPSFERASAGKKSMSELGKLMLVGSYTETAESRREALQPIIRQLRAQFDNSVHDRQVFNLAVVIGGLDFLDQRLQTVFGDALRGDIDRLRQAVFEHKSEINTASMSEAAKTLNDISLVTRTEDSESEYAIREGREFIVKDGYIEILMRETFIKYFAWCKRKGLVPYFANSDAFMSAMSKFAPIVDKLCATSPLKTSGQARVFRFSLEKLSAEGVEGFKTKATKS